MESITIHCKYIQYSNQSLLNYGACTEQEDENDVLCFHCYACSYHIWSG